MRNLWKKGLPVRLRGPGVELPHGQQELGCPGLVVSPGPSATVTSMEVEEQQSVPQVQVSAAPSRKETQGIGDLSGEGGSGDSTRASGQSSRGAPDAAVTPSATLEPQGRVRALSQGVLGLGPKEGGGGKSRPRGQSGEGVVKAGGPAPSSSQGAQSAGDFTLWVREEDTGLSSRKGDLDVAAEAALLASRSKPQVFDCHFHLDRSFRSLGRRDWTRDESGEIDCGLDALVREAGVPEAPNVELEGGVASFCDEPSIFKIAGSSKLREHLASQKNCWYAMGCHPKRATRLARNPRRREALVGTIVDLLEMDRVVALGEIGLDFSCPDLSKPFQVDDFAEQRELLRMVLSASQAKLDRGCPIVLHIREADDSLREHAREGTTALLPGRELSAREETLRILKEFVGRDQKIYLHCFSGGEAEVSFWLREFDNVAFGAIHDLKRLSDEAIVHLFKSHRLVLETDAPYFPWDRKVEKISSPRKIVNTLVRVANRLPPMKATDSEGFTDVRPRTLSLREVAAEISAVSKNFFGIC